MRRRWVLAAVVELVPIALVAGMFVYSVYMAHQEKAWREQGMAVGPATQVAVDVAMWWLKYWWTAVPLVVLGGLALGVMIVFAGRPTHSGRTAAP